MRESHHRRTSELNKLHRAIHPRDKCGPHGGAAACGAGYGFPDAAGGRAVVRRAIMPYGRRRATRDLSGGRARGDADDVQAASRIRQQHIGEGRRRRLVDSSQRAAGGGVLPRASNRAQHAAGTVQPNTPVRQHNHAAAVVWASHEPTRRGPKVGHKPAPRPIQSRVSAATGGGTNHGNGRGHSPWSPIHCSVGVHTT